MGFGVRSRYLQRALGDVKDLTDKLTVEIGYYDVALLRLEGPADNKQIAIKYARTH